VLRTDRRRTGRRRAVSHPLVSTRYRPPARRGQHPIPRRIRRLPATDGPRPVTSHERTAPARSGTPLNRNLTWTCFDTGAGPVCQGTYEDAWADEDLGEDCDGQPIYTSGSGVERMTRWRLPDGRATKTVVNLRDRDTLSLSPSGDGPVVHLRASWNRHYDSVPGDRSTRVAVCAVLTA
jgi:hypothetical protein